MRSRKVGIPTYVIASNRLAGEFLVQVLTKDPLLLPIFCEKLPQPPLGTPIIFVLEWTQAPLPLSECIQKLSSLFPTGRFILSYRTQRDKEVVGFIRLGFHGFVEHAKVVETLAAAVRAVAAGRVWFSEHLLPFANMAVDVKHSMSRANASASGSS
jgi:DNA-binding NarL/FixJ family response regulator